MLSINSDSVTYGNDPDCTLDGIVSKYGDRIVNVNGAYEMPEKDGNFTIKYKTGKLTITDADGNDSSDCYSYEAAEKDICNSYTVAVYYDIVKTCVLGRSNGHSVLHKQGRKRTA